MGDAEDYPSGWRLPHAERRLRSYSNYPLLERTDLSDEAINLSTQNRLVCVLVAMPPDS